MRQARDYVSGATSELREELGPEFDDLRQPISELQKLRGMTPRAALTKHLLDGDDSWLTGNFDDTAKPHTTPPAAAPRRRRRCRPAPRRRSTPTPPDRRRDCRHADEGRVRVCVSAISVAAP